MVCVLDVIGKCAQIILNLWVLLGDFCAFVDANLCFM